MIEVIQSLFVWQFMAVFLPCLIMLSAGLVWEVYERKPVDRPYDWERSGL